MATLNRALDALVDEYRRRPLQFWISLFEAIEEIHDYAIGDEDSPSWWQADTAVLEVAEASDGRTYAFVSITLFSQGILSSPPSPNAGFTVYSDGVVTGYWANGTEFKITSIDIASMPPIISLERLSIIPPLG